jgi:hypothetical protein
VPQTEVKLYAGADIGRMGIPGRAMAVVTHFLTGV